MLHRYHYPTGVADIKAANKKVAYTRLYQIAKKDGNRRRKRGKKFFLYPEDIKNHE